MKEQTEEMRNEQIGEMAKALMNAINEKQGHTSMRALAEALYTAGYRKQREGEWLIPASGEPWEGNSFGLCSRCGKVDNGFIKKAHNLCPNCGAHMRGGKNE